MHQLGNVFDRHHLPFEDRKNFRQRDGADLHVAQRKLFARDAPREVVHQFFFANREAVHDAALLPLERFAFEDLRNSAAQELDAALHVFLEVIGLSARQREQARPVRTLEIVDVAAIQRRFRRGMNLVDHVRDRAAAAGSGKTADKNVVSRRAQLDAHFQRAKGAFLADQIGDQFGFGRGFKRNRRGIAAPPQLFGRQSSKQIYGFSGHRETFVIPGALL